MPSKPRRTPRGPDAKHWSDTKHVVLTPSTSPTPSTWSRHPHAVLTPTAGPDPTQVQTPATRSVPPAIGSGPVRSTRSRHEMPLKQESREAARTTWAMSVSSEVQRTLVKSPPELWAELSNPTALSRHLGKLGEIRIVRTEPERTVEWEAATDDGTQSAGRVEIAPSGWGTKVTLSANRTLATPEPEVITPEPEPAAIGPEPEVITLEPEPATIGPEPEPITPEPEPRKGFFAKLFRRRRHEPKPKPAQTVETEPIEAAATDEPGPAAEESVPTDERAPEMDISTELAELEEQTTAVLTGVLDRLGAAHHRPFSRS